MKKSLNTGPFGLLVINKPGGMTSRRVVDELQRRTDWSQIGHAGTLDPLATGVLLLAVGNATRLVEYLHELGKVYVAEFEFGKSSDTLDSDGVVQCLSNSPIPSREQLAQQCQRWIGRVQQVPPKYSAIHVRGERAYALARAGKDFQLAPREVHVERIEILDYTYPRLRLRIDCGSGTYVRSIGRDIAHGLGTDAIMTQLNRAAIGPFCAEDASKLEEIQTSEDALQRLINPVRGLANWKTICLDAIQVTKVGNGQKLPMSSCSSDSQRAAAVDADGRLIALLQRVGDSDHWKPFRVFQASNATNQPTNNNAKHNPES